MAIEFGLTPDSRRDIDAASLVAAAAGAGFSAVGMAGRQADAASAAALADAGLRCHEMLALVVGPDEESTLSQARLLAEAAATVRAQWVLTTFLVPLDAATAGLIRQCAALFAAAGAGMAVEFSPLGAVPSIAAALAVAEAAGAGRAGVLIDSWHFLLGDPAWEQLKQVPLDQIAYVQFADAPPPVSPNMMREAMHRRALPGAGTLDLRRFAATLLDRGWSGLVSAEILSAELRTRPAPEFAGQAYQATARYWQ